MEKFEYMTLINVVERTIEKFPNHVALVQEDNQMEINYKTLQVYINNLTKSLQSFINIMAPNQITNPQDTPLVSLMTQRSIGTIVAILSILKSGAAYVPVDPTFPSDRQAHIFNHSKSLLLIVDEYTYEQVKLFDIDIPPILVIDSNTGEIKLNLTNLQSPSSSSSSSSPIIQPNPHNLAYVLYTSGSTGKPKGVMVINHSVVNIVQFFARDIQATEKDVVLGLTTLCFDISVLETFLPLFVGGRLIIASSAAQKNPYRIVEVLDQHKVTVMQATPTTYEMLFAIGWDGNTNITFLVGGEACRPSVTRLTTNSVALLNVYGPTETTIWSTWFRFPSGPWDVSQKVPVGKAISATNLYLVNEQMQLVNEVAGEDEGELCIGGQGVALGYLHAPELSIQRFLPDPFQAPSSGQRIYKTGDSVKRLSDGNYIFQRRLDDQVKVNGYRIELGEIELALSSHTSVDQAVVIVRNEALCGYIKLKPEFNTNGISVTLKELAVHVGSKLPKYMIPKYMMFMDQYPQTANGKLDKQKFPDIPITGFEDDTEIEPDTEITNTDLSGVEKDEVAAHPDGSISMTQFIIKRIQKVSGNKKVKSSSSFAMIGVDSLAAVMFRSALSRALDNVEIDSKALYDPRTTVESFSITLYQSLLTTHPQILHKNKIVSAVDDGLIFHSDGATQNRPHIGNNSTYNIDIKLNGNDITENDDDDNEQDTHAQASDAIVGRAALMNKNLLEGVRGFLIILVMIDHFAWNNVPLYGYRLSCDTFLFILLSGFTTLLSDFSPFNIFDSKPQPWSWRKFIVSRWIGLFPMYWLAIILAIPRTAIARPYVISSGQLTPTQYGVLTVLYILGLNTWDKQQNDIAHDFYYVSLIWSIFLLFTMVKVIHHNSTHISHRIIGYICVAGTIYGISFYYSALVGPISGSAYFTFGAFLAFGYKHAVLYLHQNNLTYENLSSRTSSDDPIITHNHSNSQSHSNDVMSDTHRTSAVERENPTQAVQSATSSDKQIQILVAPTSFNNQETNTYSYTISTISFYAFKHMPDLLIAVLLFVIFFTGYPRNSSTFKYTTFDIITFFLFGPVLFAIALFISLLQINPDQRSFWAQICETNLFVEKLGKCSLAIYIFQILFVDFYYATIVEWIEKGVFPWTIPYQDGPFYANQFWSYGQPWWVTLIGVLITVILCILIQLQFQEKWVMSIYAKVNESNDTDIE